MCLARSHSHVVTPTLTRASLTVAGSVKAEAKAKAASMGENMTPQTQQMPNQVGSVPLATPEVFLPREALESLAAQGKLGTVAAVEG